MNRWRASRRPEGVAPEPKPHRNPDHNYVPPRNEDRLLALQRSAGNRAVQQLLPRAQGEPIPGAERQQLESAFGADLSQVRVHRDQGAANLTNDVHVSALTTGRDIYFAQGMYTPRTPKGGLLLAHEVAHVVQQGGLPEFSPETEPRAIRHFAEADSLEHEAERAGRDFQAGGYPRVSHAAFGSQHGYLQSYGDPIPDVANASVKTMAEFIALVRRVEAANPGLGALAIADKIRETKYHSWGWGQLLPSSDKTTAVSMGGGVTSADVTTLGGEFEVSLPQGGQSDPSHIVAALVANAETQSPGWPISDVVPSALSQLAFATWAGDVGSAAAEWMTAHPLAKGGETKQSYMDEYAPESDLIADVDGVAMTSTIGSAGFVFAPSQSLSDNLQRFYFPAAAREGKNRRFHAFCAVQGWLLERDGVTLSLPTCITIDSRIWSFADFFSRNDPHILIWMDLNAGGVGDGAGLYQLFDSDSVPKLWIRRAHDWLWFAEKFRAFLQRNLSAEGK